MTGIRFSSKMLKITYKHPVKIRTYTAIANEIKRNLDVLDMKVTPIDARMTGRTTFVRDQLSSKQYENTERMKLSYKIKCDYPISMLSISMILYKSHLSLLQCEWQCTVSPSPAPPLRFSIYTIGIAPLVAYTMAMMKIGGNT